MNFSATENDWGLRGVTLSLVLSLTGCAAALPALHSGAAAIAAQISAAPVAAAAGAAGAGVGFAWVLAVAGSDGAVGGLIVVFVGEKRFVTREERSGLDRAVHGLQRVLTAEARIDAEHSRRSTDPLTGVATRAVALASIGADLTPASILLVRVEGLAALNAEFGTEAGDAVLVHVAAALRAVGRQRDLVGRLSARTFVVVAAGRAAGRHAVDAGTDHPLHLRCNHLEVDLTVPAKWRCHGRYDACRTCLHGPAPCASIPCGRSGPFCWRSF